MYSGTIKSSHSLYPMICADMETDHVGWGVVNRTDSPGSTTCASSCASAELMLLCVRALTTIGCGKVFTNCRGAHRASWRFFPAASCFTEIAHVYGRPFRVTDEQSEDSIAPSREISLWNNTGVLQLKPVSLEDRLFASTGAVDRERCSGLRKGEPGSNASHLLPSSKCICARSSPGVTARH